MFVNVIEFTLKIPYSRIRNKLNERNSQSIEANTPSIHIGELEIKDEPSDSFLTLEVSALMILVIASIIFISAHNLTIKCRNSVFL